MKYLAIFALVAVIIIPATTSAFSLDDAVKQWMTYMRQKVGALEKENAALKTQLAAQSATSDAVAAPPTQTAEEREWKTQIAEYSIQNLKLNNAIRTFNAATAMNPDKLRLARQKWEKEWASEFPSVVWSTQELSAIADTFAEKIGANTEAIAYIEIELARKGYSFIRYAAPCNTTGSQTSPAVGVPISYSCIGDIPANASMWDAEESTDLTGMTTRSYSASDTTTKCQYKCKMGYKVSSNTCVPTSSPSYFCTQA